MILSYKQKFLDNLIILLLVLSTGGLLFVFNRNLWYFIFCSLLVLTLFFSLEKLKKSVLNASLLTILSILFLLVLNYIFAIPGQSINKYAYYFMISATSVFTLNHFINNRSMQVFTIRVYTILQLILFHAFFNFLIYFIFKNNLSIISSANYDYETLFNLFFYMPERGIINIFGLEFCRNQGVFWEPGVLQGFLNILFFLEAFVIKKRKSLLLLTAFVILTTYSTTGLALLLLQTAIYIQNEFKRNKILISLVLLFAIPVYFIFSINVDEKIKGEKEASFQKRLFDLTQPFFIALEYPLTGVGLDLDQFQKMRQEFYFSSVTLESLQKQIGIKSTVTDTDKGSSNSVMFLLAATGFPTTFLFLLMFFRQQIIKEKRWLWIIILLISVMSEPLLLRPFFFIFIISGFIHTFKKITSFKQQIR